MPRCRPGTFGKADGAAERLTEIGDAFVKINKPFIHAPNFLLLRKDSTRGTGLHTNLAINTKVLRPNILGFIRYQWHVSCRGG